MCLASVPTGSALGEVMGRSSITTRHQPLRLASTWPRMEMTRVARSMSDPLGSWSSSWINADFAPVLPVLGASSMSSHSRLMVAHASVIAASISAGVS